VVGSGERYPALPGYACPCARVSIGGGFVREMKRTYKQRYCVHACTGTPHIALQCRWPRWCQMSCPFCAGRSVSRLEKRYTEREIERTAVRFTRSSRCARIVSTRSRPRVLDECTLRSSPTAAEIEPPALDRRWEGGGLGMTRIHVAVGGHAPGGCGMREEGCQ
jgi:hypothetical protein